MTLVLFSSIRSMFRNRITHGAAAAALSDSYDVIHPKERTCSPPAIHLDDEDIRRISSAAEFYPLDLEFSRMQGGTYEVPELRLYAVRDAILIQGNLFLKGYRLPYRRSRSHILYCGNIAKYEDAAIASTPLGNQFFGHWLLDDLTRCNALSDLGHKSFLVGNTLSTHQQQYMELLCADGEMHDNAAFGVLRVLQESPMQSFISTTLAAHRDRLRHGLIGSPSHRGVMMLRQATGRKRVLVNEREIADQLSQHGMAILDPMRASISEMREIIGNADFVIGVEGSHMTHAIPLLRRDSAFITIQPPFKFDNTCKPYCDALGIRYGFTVGQQCAGGFSVELSRVLKAIDKVTSIKHTRASFAG